MVSMTIALNLAIDINEDPRTYGARADDIIRGAMEVTTLLCVVFLTVSEIRNIIM